MRREISIRFYNPFKPELTIVISSTIRNSRLVVDEDDLKWVKN